jgi:lipid-A-disaccharide synthase
MQAAGCDTLVPMERLSVMGLTQVLRHLRELLRIRGDLIRYFLDWRPDVFIGVDAPDFNLGLERRLREAGIRTVHLVSPTIWAWRAGRVKTIRRSLDLMLSIFPFEEEFLRRHGVPVRYVGHPLADEIPPQNAPVVSRAQLGMSPGGPPVLALLPGSRMSEVRLLSAPFLRTARWCLERYPGLRFTVPLVTQTLRAVFTEVLRREAPALPVTLVDGRSRDVWLRVPAPGTPGAWGDDDPPTQVKVVGDAHVLLALAKDLGLQDALIEAFGSEDALTLLSLALYQSGGGRALGVRCVRDRGESPQGNVLFPR